MRPENDPTVQQAARRIADGVGVVAWPEGLDTGGACALLVLRPGSQFLLAWAPGHRCAQPDQLVVKAAQTMFHALDHGPDDGWRDIGSGLSATWLVVPEEVRPWAAPETDLPATGA